MLAHLLNIGIDWFCWVRITLLQSLFRLVPIARPFGSRVYYDLCVTISFITSVPSASGGGNCHSSACLSSTLSSYNDDDEECCTLNDNDDDDGNDVQQFPTFNQIFFSHHHFSSFPQHPIAYKDCQIWLEGSVTRLGDLLDFEQIFKAFGYN